MKILNDCVQHDHWPSLKITLPKPRTKPVLPARISSDVMRVMEAFPRIGDNITLMWGYLELKQYLRDLIVNERGIHPYFPPEIAAAIMRIHDEHCRLFPHANADVWNSVLY
jgi:hypothetical protein